MAKELLINVSEGEECRIALVEDGKLEELYMERTSSTSHVGNIYKGKVTNVEASIQAAFVDFGLGRNGFLHISDLMPTYFGRKGEEIVETVGKKMARRDRPPIQRCLRRGDEIIVQIIKEGIGTKGPTLSSYLSIPGRILVMMPGVGKMGVSRKIEDDDERRRLRHILDGLRPPKDLGFIIRTAGVGKAKTEIERDLKYLTRLWETIERKRQAASGPAELYAEGDLITRTVRDVYTADVDRIIVDTADVAERIKEVIKISSPRTKERVELYEEGVPLFHKYGIEKEIELMYSRHVPLPSGGSLVIDQTEAVVAIDVNSGKFRDHSDAETTAFKTDMEAADEICRQLKLRDLGGVIICDFIDLRYERHRRELEKKLHDNLKRDKAKTKVLGMSQFGIIEMTRQRMRPSFKRSVYFDCPHCKGAGLVKTPESMSIDVMRRLAIGINDLKVARVELTINPEVNFYIQNKKRRQIADLEDQNRKRVVIRADPHMALDEMKLELYDTRDGLVFLTELESIQSPIPHTTQLGHRPPGQAAQGRGGRPGDRRPQPGRRPQPVQGRRDEEDDDLLEDRLDMDRADEPDDREDADTRDEPETREADAPAPRGRGDQNRGGRGDPRPAADQRRDNRDGPRGRDDQRPRDAGGRNDRDPRDNRFPRDDRGVRAGPPARDDRDFDDAGDDRDADEGQETRDTTGDRAGGRQQERPARDDRGGRGNRDDNRRPAPQGQGDRPQPQPAGRPDVRDANRDANRGGQRPPVGQNGQPVEARREDADGGEGGTPLGEEQGGRRRRRRRRRGRRGRGGQGEGGTPGMPGEDRPPLAPGEEWSAAESDDQFEPESASDDRREDDGDDREDAEEAFTEAADISGRSSDRDRYPEVPDLFTGSDERDEARPGDATEADDGDREPHPAEAEGAAAEPDEEPVVVVDESPTPEAPAEAPEPAAKPRRGAKGTKAKQPRAPRKKKAAAPPDDAEAASAETPTAEAPKKRGRAGGAAKARPRRRGPAGAADTEAAPAATPPPPAGVKIASEVTPTASRRGLGDRHLMRDAGDDTLTPEPPRRPRSYRDLDAIPDDLD